MFNKELDLVGNILRILVVSGKKAERNRIREYILRLPFREYDKSHLIDIIEENSASAALDRLKSDYQAMIFYDLIIADQNMDKMTGLQLAHEISNMELAPPSPIAIFSDDLKRDIPKNYGKNGIAAFFELPVSYRQMKRLMTKIAALRIAREERKRKLKIENLMSIRGTRDFLSSLESIYLHSASEINMYRMYAPWSALPYIILGRVYIGSNRFSEAIPHLKTAIKINFNNKDAHRNLLLCYKKTGKFFAEREELEVMLRTSPRSCNVLLKVGETCLREGEYQSAMDYFRRAIANHKPSDSNRLKAKSHLGLGKAYMKQGDRKKDPSIYDLAKDEFNKAVSIDPLLIAAYNNLAIAFNKLGRHEEAKSTIAKAVGIIPKDAEGWFSLFELYLIDGETEKARNSLIKALKYDPENQIWLITAGEIYLRQGMLTDAIEMFEEAVEINPSYAELYNYLGICYRRLNNIESAILNYQKALEIDREDQNIHYNLGKAFHVDNKLESARKSYENALRLEPNFQEAKQKLTILEAYTGVTERLKSVR